eukprot:jgi/Mesvir1/22633/Mv14069-RA.1
MRAPAIDQAKTVPGAWVGPQGNAGSSSIGSRGSAESAEVSGVEDASATSAGPKRVRRTLLHGISIDDLAMHFHKPMVQAAAEFGVCPSVLKRACRRFGITRWPYRKMIARMDMPAGPVADAVKRNRVRCDEARTRYLSQMHAGYSLFGSMPYLAPQMHLPPLQHQHPPQHMLPPSQVVPPPARFPEMPMEQPSQFASWPCDPISRAPILHL